MKKVFLSVLLVLFSISLFACTKDQEFTEYKMIIPTGTPTLALGGFIENEMNVTSGVKVNADIVSGSDLLVAAFTQQNYDIIVAPLNLGVKFYNESSNFEYVLYKPIVGCNYYILSSTIEDFASLDGQDLAMFGKNSTPSVVLDTLCKYYNITPNVTYYDAVTDVNPLLLSGKVNSILTAEPSKTVVTNNKTFNVIDLAALWKEMAKTNYDIPQAAIFVKKEVLKKDDLNKILEKMKNSLQLSISNPASLASSAIKVDENLSKQSVENLTKAIPNCNILTHDLNKEEVEFYLNKIVELGLSKTIGGKLPDEKFYY